MRRFFGWLGLFAIVFFLYTIASDTIEPTPMPSLEVNP